MIVVNRFTATGLAVDMVAGKRVIVVAHHAEVQATLSRLAGCDVLTMLKTAPKVNRANGCERIAVGDGWVRIITSGSAHYAVRAVTADVVLIDDPETARRLSTSGLLEHLRPALAPGGEIVRA